MNEDNEPVLHSRSTGFQKRQKIDTFAPQAVFHAGNKSLPNRCWGLYLCEDKTATEGINNAHKAYKTISSRMP